MPLTEINVTTPKPHYANYWRDRDAAKAAAPPPPPWPAVDPGLLEDGRRKLPPFPLQVFPGQWRPGGGGPPPGAEPAAWLAGLGRKSRRDESRRGPFLDTWGAIGLPWGRGDKPAVSIVGSLDPERLDAALEGTGDGLAARFLYVWPGPAPYRSLRTLKPTREDEMVNALQRISRAVGTPEKPLVLAFEDRAVTVFDACLERLHGETLRAEGLLAGWLGKGRGTQPRLAARLALLDWTANRPSNGPPPGIITEVHLHAAWGLWERYHRP